MEKKALTSAQEQAKKALLTGHFPYMTQAVAMAYQLVPAWREAVKGTPCSILDLFQTANKYDETHPRREDDHAFFYVTLEGAIGYCPTGLEFQITWLFYPMEPGQERDAIVARVKEEVEAAEKAAAEAEAEKAAAAEAEKAAAEAAAAAAAAAAPRKHFCANCGAPIKNPNAKFCGNCGQPLD